MISTLNKIGNGHNTCQDNLYVTNNQEMGLIHGAICDGSGGGIKTEFASQLLIYLLQKRGGYTTSDMDMVDLINEFGTIARSIGLTTVHQLSTTMLSFMYLPNSEILILRAFGDGFYKINDIEYSIDQEGKPDYPGFHIDDIGRDLDNYVTKYPRKTFTNVKSFQICSDGINSAHFSQFREPSNLVDPKQFLLEPPKSENILERKYNILKRAGFSFSDDLSIISYVKD